MSALVLMGCIAGRLSAMQPVAPQVVVPPPEVHIHLPPEEPSAPVAPLPEWQDKGKRRFALADAPGVLSAWEGVEAAPGAPVMVVWGRGAVSWSGDEGASWTRHSLGGGESVRWSAAEGGWVHLMIQGDKGAMWSFSPSGARTVRRAPLAVEKIEALAGGFDRLAVIGSRGARGESGGEVALLTSGDHGANWQSAPAPDPGNAGHDLAIEADGTLVHIRGEECACGGGGQSLERLAPGAVDWVREAWPVDTPFQFWAAPGGWEYALGDCRVGGELSERSHLCAIGDSEEATVAGPKVKADAGADVVSNGKWTYAVAGRALFAVRGPVFKPMASDVPAALDLGETSQSGRSTLRVDSKGRVLGVAAGHLVRWSVAGWEVLLPG